MRLAGREPARAHVVAERGDRRCPSRPSARRRTCPAPRRRDEVALAHELVERRADGEARDAEVDAELPLGRDRVADARAPRSARAPARASRAASSPTAASAGRGRQPREPRAGLRVEEVEAAGVDRERRAARRRGRPSARSTRAVKSARPAGSNPLFAAASSTSAVIGGASTWKKTWASEPRSSSTSTATLDRRQAGGERRRPRSSPAGCRATTCSVAGGGRPRRAARGTGRSGRRRPRPSPRRGSSPASR